MFMIAKFVALFMIYHQQHFACLVTINSYSVITLNGKMKTNIMW